MEDCWSQVGGLGLHCERRGQACSDSRVWCLPLAANLLHPHTHLRIPVVAAPGLLAPVIPALAAVAAAFGVTCDLVAGGGLRLALALHRERGRCGARGGTGCASQMPMLSSLGRQPAMLGPSLQGQRTGAPPPRCCTPSCQSRSSRQPRSKGFRPEKMKAKTCSRCNFWCTSAHQSSRLCCHSTGSGCLGRRRRKCFQPCTSAAAVGIGRERRFASQPA